MKNKIVSHLQTSLVLSLLLVPIFLLGISGCAEKPQSIGSGLPSPGLFSSTDTMTLYSISDTSYIATIISGYAGNTLVGRIQTQELISLYNFYSTVPIDSLINATIDSVEFRLTVNYRLTPSSPPIKLNVYEMNQPWSEATFTKDSFQLANVGNINIGTFHDSMSYRQEVVARIDTSSIRKWVKAATDTTAPHFYGFAVRADQSFNGVIGFLTFSSSLTPVLFIRYTHNGIRDSLTMTYGYDTYITTSLTPPTISKLEVRGAIAVRSKVNFNLETLPQKTVINNATLTLIRDASQSSLSGYAPDSILAVMSLSKGTLPLDSVSSIFTYGVKKIFSTAPDTLYGYEFNLTGITQRWITPPYENDGINLRWISETSSADRVVFYPSSYSDYGKRPKLKITYSK